MTACSKDDDYAASTETFNPELIGKWHTASADYYEDGRHVYFETFDFNANCPDHAEFKSDRTITIYEFDEVCEIFEESSGNYEWVNDSILILSDPYVVDTVKINFSSPTQMNMEGIYEQYGISFREVYHFNKIE